MLRGHFPCAQYSTKVDGTSEKNQQRLELTKTPAASILQVAELVAGHSNFKSRIFKKKIGQLEYSSCSQASTLLGGDVTLLTMSASMASWAF
jgi:hypothetical protein